MGRGLQPSNRGETTYILIAQSLYALGVLLCVIGAYWGIGFIALVQLYDAIAPRIPGRSR